ncbi:hypothetical protein [Pseudomonas duriflava]|uniref:hypothetical protein n=1 Tax=Pseudomonas duriflava TaxID=459528 RepID=UPI001FCABF1F|nr:hypothetical protein [Pseudomonas duriflava]
MSTQFSAIPKIAPLFANVADETVVIDTSNYYPKRDGVIEAIEAGQTESAWVAKSSSATPVARAFGSVRESKRIWIDCAPRGTMRSCSISTIRAHSARRSAA